MRFNPQGGTYQTNYDTATQDYTITVTGKSGQYLMLTAVSITIKNTRCGSISRSTSSVYQEAITALAAKWARSGLVLQVPARRPGARARAGEARRVNEVRHARRVLGWVPSLIETSTDAAGVKHFRRITLDEVAIVPAAAPGSELLSVRPSCAGVAAARARLAAPPPGLPRGLLPAYSMSTSRSLLPRGEPRCSRNSAIEVSDDPADARGDMVVFAYLLATFNDTQALWRIHIVQHFRPHIVRS